MSILTHPLPFVKILRNHFVRNLYEEEQILFVEKQRGSNWVFGWVT